MFWVDVREYLDGVCFSLLRGVWFSVGLGFTPCGDAGLGGGCRYRLTYQGREGLKVGHMMFFHYFCVSVHEGFA